MTKQPFTPDGVKLKTTELYALNSADLKAQSRLIATQFITWVTDNFNLTTDQDNYLNGMDGDYLTFLSGELSSAVGSQLPVTLITSGDPPSGDTGSKRFETKSTITRVIDAGAVKGATGSVTIQVSYPE